MKSRNEERNVSNKKRAKHQVSIVEKKIQSDSESIAHESEIGNQRFYSLIKEDNSPRFTFFFFLNI